MVDVYIKDNKFHYKGVDYSIFAKWKNLENGTEDNVVIKTVYDDNSFNIYNRDTKKYIVSTFDRLILEPYHEKGKSGGGYGRFKFDLSGTKFVTECSGWKLYYKTIAGKDGKKDTYVNKLVKNKETQSNKTDWEQIKGALYTQEAFKWNKADQTFEKWGSELTEDQLKHLCALLSKYYGSEEKPAPAPPIPAPTPEKPSPTQSDAIVKIFRQFDTPLALSEFEGGVLAKQKWDALQQLEATLNDIVDKSDKPDEVVRDRQFIRKYMNARVWFTNPIDGEPFTVNISKESTEASRLDDYRLFLSNILSLGGVPYFNIGEAAIEGLKVHVDGEANYESNKEYNDKQKGNDKRPDYTLTSGALLSSLEYYGLQNAIEIARNFITNYFVASFKYPDFTQQFKDMFVPIEVEYDEEQYDGKIKKVGGTVYYMNFPDKSKWLYILLKGGYAALYCNDFMIGYNLVTSMVSKPEYLLNYAKDVEGFTEGLMSATRPYKQLRNNYPVIFRKLPSTLEPAKVYSIEQDIADLEFLLSLEKDPIEYAKLKKELDDVKFLQSLS